MEKEIGTLNVYTDRNNRQITKIQTWHTEERKKHKTIRREAGREREGENTPLVIKRDSWWTGVRRRTARGRERRRRRRSSPFEKWCASPRRAAPPRPLYTPCHYVINSAVLRASSVWAEDLPLLRGFHFLCLFISFIILYPCLIVFLFFLHSFTSLSLTFFLILFFYFSCTLI